MTKGTKADGHQGQSAVSIRNLWFSYEEHPVLRGLSLEVGKGECFGIIGPSGAGKSTLLLHLNGILTGEGQVRILGIEMNRANRKDIRRHVGLVFQNPDDQLFNPTVEEDIAFGPLNLGMTREEVNDRVSSVLKLMHLEGFENKTSHHLSFGERKRVALATVLVMNPAVIAFDEPFSNLDPGTIQQLIGSIRNLEATVLIVSQQIIPALAVCDRLAVLRDGRIVKVGTSREVAADKSVLKASNLDFGFYRDILHDVENF